MAEHLPSEHGHAPPITCSRWFDEGWHCLNDATWHVIWEVATMRNGLCCDTHEAEIHRKRWTFDAAHPYEMACSMPGATFLPDENRCVVDEDSVFADSVLVDLGEKP